MTSKDFEAIAEAIKAFAIGNYLVPEAHERLVNLMIRACRSRYRGAYSFREDKFRKACGLEG